MTTLNLDLPPDCENYIKLIEYLRKEGIKLVTLQPNDGKPLVSGSLPEEHLTIGRKMNFVGSKRQ